MNTLFFKACEQGDIKVVKWFIDQEIDINYQDKLLGHTGLHIASKYYHLEVVKLLVKNGADINKQTYRSLNTPLHHAFQNYSMSEYLLSKGADPNIKNKHGQLAFDFEEIPRSKEKARIQYKLLGENIDALDRINLMKIEQDLINLKK